ncbi:unnamed protein product [Amoebophrya sp. A25]|nr:unnamed protein product [Amoebophrya sp. A25]|eukprot:GSA25T00024247001.1
MACGSPLAVVSAMLGRTATIVLVLVVLGHQEVFARSRSGRVLGRGGSFLATDTTKRAGRRDAGRFRDLGDVAAKRANYWRPSTSTSYVSQDNFASEENNQQNSFSYSRRSKKNYNKNPAVANSDQGSCMSQQSARSKRELRSYMLRQEFAFLMRNADSTEAAYRHMIREDLATAEEQLAKVVKFNKNREDTHTNNALGTSSSSSSSSSLGKSSSASLASSSASLVEQESSSQSSASLTKATLDQFVEQTNMAVFQQALQNDIERLRTSLRNSIPPSSSRSAEKRSREVALARVASRPQENVDPAALLSDLDRFHDDVSSSADNDKQRDSSKAGDAAGSSSSASEDATKVEQRTEAEKHRAELDKIFGRGTTSLVDDPSKNEDARPHLQSQSQQDEQDNQNGYSEDNALIRLRQEKSLKKQEKALKKLFSSKSGREEFLKRVVRLAEHAVTLLGRRAQNAWNVNTACCGCKHAIKVAGDAMKEPNLPKMLGIPRVLMEGFGMPDGEIVTYLRSHLKLDPQDCQWSRCIDDLASHDQNSAFGLAVFANRTAHLCFAPQRHLSVHYTRCDLDECSPEWCESYVSEMELRANLRQAAVDNCTNATAELAEAHEEQARVAAMGDNATNETIEAAQNDTDFWTIQKPIRCDVSAYPTWPGHPQPLGDYNITACNQTFEKAIYVNQNDWWENLPDDMFGNKLVKKLGLERIWNPPAGESSFVYWQWEDPKHDVDMTDHSLR